MIKKDPMDFCESSQSTSDGQRSNPSTNSPRGPQLDLSWEPSNSSQGSHTSSHGTLLSDIGESNIYFKISSIGGTSYS